ncbi:unnamed protein product [Leptosia nina]|uniref:Protein cortex n=1 Tax=Leptosia nina TaxID=320188 RepID=A0AAV1JEP6_9NEOP
MEHFAFNKKNAPKPWNQRIYISRLNKVFGIEEPNIDHTLKPWPCKPRKRSCLSSADFVLDLPTLNYSNVPEILDWSCNDFLVAALGNGYHMWDWGSQTVSGKGYSIHNFNSCKFDPRGELLLLGTDMKEIEVHDNTINKRISLGTCVCPKRGCTRGMVASFTRKSELISHFRKVPGRRGLAIHSVRISPDAQFAAITTLYSKEVLIVTWPYLKPFHVFEFEDSFTTTITWHPWRNCLLGRGAVTKCKQAHVSMCFPPSGKIEEAVLPGSGYSLDTMLFSDTTGELAISLYDRDKGLLHPKSSSSLLVMSDMKTVVDLWKDEGRIELNRVVTMIFSPDGTKLATATSGEDLIIWNFLPETKQKEKPRRKYNFSAIPVYMDALTHKRVLR